MAGYLIANITVTDPDRYRPYRDQVIPVIEQYGGRYLIRAEAVRPVEGAFDFDWLVVIAFPTLDAVHRFYNSPEFAPLLRLRTETTRSNVALVEGFAPG